LVRRFAEPVDLAQQRTDALVTVALRAQQAGMMFTEAGIHFFIPFGFELSSTEVRGWDGPVQLVLLEPRDGVVSGAPSSAFVSLTVHAYEIAPSAAIERVVSELSATFGNVEVEEAAVSLGGATHDAFTLSFSVAGVALRGTVAAFRDGDLTIVVYTQGQPDELEVLADVFAQILDSVGAGPAQVRELPDAGLGRGTSVGTGLGTGEGTGDGSGR
jgi:hypothetical protein